MSIDHEPIASPWVLVDDSTVAGTAALLERLTAWLDGPDTKAAKLCARALSLGETNDPQTISSWSDALEARLRHCAENSQFHLDG